MKDLPIKAGVNVLDRNLLPPKENLNTPQEQEKTAKLAQNVDASIVSLPRVKPKDGSLGSDASAALDSFLSNVGDGKELVDSHSRLDAARVFDLLNSEE